MLDLQNNVNTTTNNNGCEAVKLLELSSSDSLDSPSFTHFQTPKPKRKVRFKKVFRSGSKSKSSNIRQSKICKCQLTNVMKLIGYVMLLAILCMLIWYVMALSTKIQELQDKFHDVEAGNRNTPEAFHVIHSKLKQLDFNVSTLFLEISKNLADIVNCTSEIIHLKEITSNIKESIAAAPELQDLPKELSSLSESVAGFGSKINALESTAKELKESQSSLQSTTQSLSGEINSIKFTLQDLSNATKVNSFEVKSPNNLLMRDRTFQSAIEETNQQVSYLQKELVDLVRSVDKMNSSFIALSDLITKVDTLNNAVVWNVNETQHQKDRLFVLENHVNTNLTLRLEHVENEGLKSITHGNSEISLSSVQEIVNKTIMAAVLKITNPDANPVELLKASKNASQQFLIHAHDVLLLLANLLKEINHVPDGAILSKESAADIINHLLEHTFNDRMKYDSKFQDLKRELDELKHSNAMESTVTSLTRVTEALTSTASQSQLTTPKSTP